MEPYLNLRRTTAQPAAAGRRAFDFHRTLPDYRPTPLHTLSELGRQLGVGELMLKDESSRLGLPSFKILGASWAIRQALGQLVGIEADERLAFELLRDGVAALRPLTLAAATDGNHGRAVARIANMLGLSSRIFVPEGTAAARIKAIEQEGATVEVVLGGYNDAVRRSAEFADDRCVVISDTSWAGYEQVPRWVIDGYSTILWEIEDELAEADRRRPNLVLVQMGVGAFAAAVTAHPLGPTPIASRTVGVEPTRAACVLESLRAGRVITLTHAQNSIMAGLNCGTPSIVAWPELASHLDASLAIGDERAREAMRLLADGGIVAGESGAAGLGGLLELLNAHELSAVRSSLDVGTDTRVLLFCTEGATDPAAYREIVGRGHDPDKLSAALSGNHQAPTQINA